MPTKLRKMPRAVHLALYGTIEHGPDDDMSWDLYQSKALSRLRDVSLSSIPSRCMPNGIAASRFHHSVGVAHLARVLCSRRTSLRPHRALLIASSLCHDLGSPPFSHVSELFLHDLAGVTHEQQTARLLAPGSELARILDEHGVDGREVTQIVNGEHEPLGPLIAGTIDLDNVDNSIHLLISLGYHENLPYHPLELINAFKVHDGRLCLDSEHLYSILGWAQVRRTLYDTLHNEPNLSSSTMLYRALEFAYAAGDLEKGFFSLGESDALHHLSEDCTQHTRTLLNRLLCWKQYPMVYEHRMTGKDDPRVSGIYDDWEARKALADRIAGELGLKPHELALYVGHDKGEKSITLPFVGPRAKEAAALFAHRKGQQKVVVFAHKRCTEMHPADADGRISHVEQAVAEAIDDLPADRPEGHAFF
jgi:HD superfamily phosphohydrolase